MPRPVGIGEVHAVITSYSIHYTKLYDLDLQPENSFVRYAVDSGHTVFMLSWRNVGPELGHLSWDDYLEDGVFTALRVARAITRADRVNALGFCSYNFV